MTDPTIPQRVLFPELGGKPVVATFDREQASSVRRRRAAHGSRAGVRPRPEIRPVSGGQARAGKDSAHAGGPGRPAGLRHRVRSSGRERCRPPRRGSHPQTAVGPGPGHRRAPGVATDAVAIRERRGPGRLVRDGPGVGRERHRTAPATPTVPGREQAAAGRGPCRVAVSGGAHGLGRLRLQDERAARREGRVGASQDLAGVGAPEHVDLSVQQQDQSVAASQVGLPQVRLAERAVERLGGGHPARVPDGGREKSMPWQRYPSRASRCR